MGDDGMMTKTIEAVLLALRDRLDPAFAADTAADGHWNELVPSGGHCAVVSMLVARMFDATYVSATLMSISHWFNRMNMGGTYWDVDITGDQFGRPRVQVVSAGELYNGTRMRLETHINADTVRRFELLVSRLP